MTAVERMSARKRERERLTLGDESKGRRGHVKMEVPTEGRGSDGMLVSLSPSKRSNSSNEGR